MCRFIAVFTITLLCMATSPKGVAQDREWARDESIVQISEHVSTNTALTSLRMKELSSLTGITAAPRQWRG
jgi:hypothetical protein